MAAVLEEFGIRYLDITACLARAAAKAALYYVQDNHLTSRGHREAADCMVENGFFALLSDASPPEPRRGGVSLTPGQPLAGS